MRLFADHCVPSDFIRALRDMGIQVERAYDVGLDRASDETIFQHAHKTGRVLLTCDLDFTNVIRFNIRDSAGVVVAHLENLPNTQMIHRIQEFFHRTRPHTLQGTLTVLEPDAIRVWPKPRK